MRWDQDEVLDMTRHMQGNETEHCDLAPRRTPPESMVFRDRAHAGRRLAAALGNYAGQRVLVLGLARGGVEVAAEVARALGGELDVLVVRKLGAPGNEELALGAVSADGEEVLNQGVLQRLGVSVAWLRAEVRRCVEASIRREEGLRAHRPAPSIRGRIALVVDDGLATGASMRAALSVVKKHGASRCVVAVPVGPRAVASALARDADEVVCLFQPESFVAVGLHYEHFEPVPDERVAALLEAGACAP